MSTKESSPFEHPEEILQIDEHHLDRECIHLPNQYRQAAFQAAELERDIAETEAELQVREADLCLKIRATPGQFHLEKVTEGAIKELLLINPELRRMEEKLRQLRFKADLMKKLCTAIDMKKRSLTNLVELHSAGYHAEVRPSPRGRESLEKISRDRISRPIPWDKKKRMREVDSD